MNNKYNIKKIANKNSITVNRNRQSDYDLVKKNYLENLVDNNTIRSFFPTLEIFLKPSVGKTSFNAKKA